MIKATGRTGDGDHLLVLGLSRTNTERLLDDQPIKVDGLDVGLPGIQVIIVGGETEQTIADQLMASGLVSEDKLQQHFHGKQDG